MIDPLDLFLDAAGHYSGRPAVIEPTGTVTYEILLTRVRRLAHAIAQTGQLHPRVAILLPQGAWAYAAMFGTMMAGGVYAPINLDHPPERRRHVLSHFEPDAMIATTAGEFRNLDLSNNCLDIPIDTLGRDALLHPASAGDLAYVMFTSGSTGEPKGVMISRSALAHYVDWAHREMAVTSDDRWSQHPNIAFDLSVLDIFGALCAGASLYPLAQRKERLLPASVIREHRLTIWNSVPSVVDLMRRTGQLDADHLGSLRLITFCGEPLLKQHLDFIFAARPDVCVHNTYGPTEATVSVSLMRLRAHDYTQYCESSVALGLPISGMTVLLEGGDTPDEGELVIAGPQIARGYWRDEVLSVQAFETRRIGSVIQPAYRTGDWVKRIGDNLYFVARIDRQIKRQGNRVELGDIDAALLAAGASAACTVFVEDRLVAFVEQPEADGVTALSRKLRELVPAYALPSEVRHVSMLPRNANDKIDAKALEAMARDVLRAERNAN